MRESTSAQRLEIFCPKPPTVYLATAVRSGWQRESRSGRGLPNTFFILLVTSQVSARLSARPLHPAFSSQSLRRQTTSRGVRRLTAGPGTRNRHMRKMMRPGTGMSTTSKSHEGTCSFAYGNEMLRSTSEKGLWNGEAKLSPPATPAMPLKGGG